MSTLVAINAKELKSELLAAGIKVACCKRGTGTTKNATYVWVDVSDYHKALDFFESKGMVTITKRPIARLKVSQTEGVCGGWGLYSLTA